MPSQCGVKTLLDSGPRRPGFETLSSRLVFHLGKEINGHCWVAQSAGNAYWAEISSVFANSLS